MSPVRDGDGNHSQDKAEDPHEHQGSTQCRLPLPTARPVGPVSWARGSWSPHLVAADGGGGGGGDGGVPLSHPPSLQHSSVFSLTGLKTAIWLLQLSFPMFAGGLHISSFQANDHWHCDQDIGAFVWSYSVVNMIINSDLQF